MDSPRPPIPPVTRTTLFAICLLLDVFFLSGGAAKRIFPSRTGQAHFPRSGIARNQVSPTLVSALRTETLSTFPNGSTNFRLPALHRQTMRPDSYQPMDSANNGAGFLKGGSRFPRHGHLLPTQIQRFRPASGRLNKQSSTGRYDPLWSPEYKQVCRSHQDPKVHPTT